MYQKNLFPILLIADAASLEDGNFIQMDAGGVP